MHPSKTVRLALVATHPIQYHSPVFRELSRRGEVELRVFYGWEGTANSIDHGFGQKVAWDIPLLDGYDWEMVPNVAKVPGSHHFRGIDLPDLNKRISKWRADAVLIYGWRYKAHLAAMRHFSGKIPVLFRGDSTLIDDVTGLRRLFRRVYLSTVYKNVDFALAVGTNNRLYFEEFGLKPGQIFWAPHAVDNARFERNASVKNEASQKWRRQLGIKDNQVVVMFVGKLEPKKAPDLLLNAFEKLNSEKIQLVYVGSGELELILKSRITSDRVHFLGFQNQTAMETVYRMAEVVVLPSRGPGETWGLALNESMACGCALIASDRVGASVDLIEVGRNGWVFKSGDEIALKAILGNCVGLGRAGLKQFGSASTEIVAGFSIAKQVDGILSCLRRCCRGRESCQVFG